MQFTYAGSGSGDEPGAKQTVPIVVHAYADGRAPGRELLEELGVPYKVVAAPGTSQDIAMIIAAEKGAELIVSVGSQFNLVEFLDKNRRGMSSTFLTRLRLGEILVDAKGRTVYVFMADSPGTSTCTGQCLDYWPAVVAPAKLPAPASGVTGKLGSITRDDGTRQLTINGWPLYTYAGDTKAGMTSGQGSSGSGAKWWVVSPAGKKITKS